ncbi:MAG TPA: winged helix-turn-helix transcriptional regulator [Candidatus Thermoplasmatota archaeon]|nr:winged helix-turn-helix transcriptional regulator [Candidatus Thermoplasmatota archaeon]
MAGVRERVLRMVDEYPGVHAREVERQLGLVSRLAQYHLDALEKEGAILRIEERGFARYASPSLRISSPDLALLCRLRRAPVLEIVLFLLRQGEATPTQISERIALAKPSTSHHLRELLNDGIVVARRAGRERWYGLRDEAQARRILDDFEPLPGELDSFARIWEDLTG